MKPETLTWILAGCSCAQAVAMIWLAVVIYREGRKIERDMKVVERGFKL